MKKAKKNFIMVCGILILLLLILQNSLRVKENIIFSVELWLTQVFPSLFPMFVLSDLLIQYNFPNYLANVLGPIFTKIFRTSPNGVFIFIMSLISGTPSSAFLLKSFLEEKLINEKEASFLLTFTFFSNPLFLMNMLAILFPNHTTSIWKIILIHYSVNILIGIIFRPKEKQKFQKITLEKSNIDFGKSLSKSLKKAMDTLFMILGTISFYYMIANLFTINNSWIQNILSGFLEMTQGLKQLSLHNFSLFWKEILAIGFISFGGLSIHTQIKSIIHDTSISYLPFLKGRILHVLFSILFVLLF